MGTRYMETATVATHLTATKFLVLRCAFRTVASLPSSSTATSLDAVLPLKSQESNRNVPVLSASTWGQYKQATGNKIKQAQPTAKMKQKTHAALRYGRVYSFLQLSEARHLIIE